MLWFVLAGLTAFAVLAAIWPLLRAPDATERDAEAASEAAFYRAQLDEIQRDVDRGHLPEGEAAAARAEAARRLLAVDSGARRPAAGARGRSRLAAAALLVIGVPAIALPLYALLGQPQMRDEPLAGREPAVQAADDVEAAVAGVEKHLIEKLTTARAGPCSPRSTCGSNATRTRRTPIRRRCGCSATIRPSRRAMARRWSRRTAAW